MQFAKDDGPVQIVNVWNEPIRYTISIMEEIVTDNVVGFNLIFDWFHFNKWYNIIRFLADNGYSDLPPIKTIIEVEALNPSNYCVLPKSALDLMLYARKGP